MNSTDLSLGMATILLLILCVLFAVFGGSLVMRYLVDRNTRRSNYGYRYDIGHAVLGGMLLLGSGTLIWLALQILESIAGGVA